MVKTDTSAIASASAVSSHTHTLDEKLKDIGVRERERETQDQAYRLGLPYVSLYGFSAIPLRRARKSSSPPLTLIIRTSSR